MSPPAQTQDWLRPCRLEYQPYGDDWAAVRLLAGLAVGRPTPPTPKLIVRSGASLRTFRAWHSGIDREGRRHTGSAALLWLVSFELPLDVVEYPNALFRLAVSGHRPLALPAPTLRNPTGRALGAALAMQRAESAGRVRGGGLRRQVTALTAGFVVAATAAAAPGVASAASPPSSVTPAAPATAPPAAPSDVTTTVTTTSTSTSTSTTSSTSASATTTPTSQTTAPSTTTTVQSPPPPPVASKPQAPAPTATLPVVAPKLPPAAKPKHPHTAQSCTVAAVLRREHKKLPADLAKQCPLPKAAHSHQTKHHRAAHHGAKSKTKAHTHSTAPRHSVTPLPSGGAAIAPAHKPAHHLAPRAARRRAAVASPQPQVNPQVARAITGAYVDPFTAAEIAQFSHVTANTDQPPSFLIPIYKAAGRRYHVPWKILAAINAIETDYGRNLSVSPAGAVGWMQFMPATWLQYGVTADGRGRPNPDNPVDAIFSAARYLAANRAATDLRRAVFAYNHAFWYVDAVLWRARTIGNRGVSALKAGYALPLDGRYMHELGRTDDGLDIETAPDGAAVYSMTPGVVTAVASDPSGFGPNYPVVLVTAGPLAGRFIYYGHVAASLVHVGQRVLAGQPIAIMGHAGDAASLGHGHIEIGFSDASGDPLNHHTADAWTPAGDAMRQFIVHLSKAFRIHNS